MFNIRYWKPSDGDKTRWVVCDKDDPQAAKFEVSYPGMQFSSSTIEFKTRYEAETFAHAIHKAYQAGRMASRAELSRWLNGAEFNATNSH